MATLVLVAVAALNALFTVFWMSWRPKHHDALASMLGVVRRNRPPNKVWLAVRKRLNIRGRAGAGIYALSEILISVFLALLAASVSFALSVAAISFAQMYGSVSVSLAGNPATGPLDVGAALFSYLVSVRLHDGFEFTNLQSARLDGNQWLTVLLITLLSVVASVGLKAVSEGCKCIWYASVCTIFKAPARDALEFGGGGFVRGLLGLEKPVGQW